MTEPIIPDPHKPPRWGLWIALAVAVTAAGVVAYLQLPDDDEGAELPPPVTVVGTTGTTTDRPDTGPPKGVSVVTSTSTTTTLPVTTTTTTTIPVPSSPSTAPATTPTTSASTASDGA